MKTKSLYRSQSMTTHTHPRMPLPLAETWSEISGSMMEMLGTTPRMGRRSMALADIDPKYVSQSGIWEASEVETSRGSIRIQHLTTAAVSAGARPLSCSATSGSGVPSLNSRFPKLEECAHFHYDTVDLPSLKIFIREDVLKPISVSGDEAIVDSCSFSIEVVSGGQSWVIRRTHANIYMLDEQLHRCVWDRSFSQLEKVDNSKTCNTSEEHDGCRALVERYLDRLSELPTNQITCGTVLSWFELDNRGRHIVASDDSAINTPAVAAACALRKYTAQATDEISFEVGDMISVIDMPPPEESVWWRGKRGFHVGFFPRDCVQVIGDKVPASLPIVPSTRRLQRLSVSSTNSTSVPAKPVLRKHGKLIAFFRSFILSRPSRRRLKQTGILRERVFSCDLAEHLLNTGNDIPAVLKCCADFIEMHGIVDGIYRLSGITSNIQKLRNAFDEDKVPNLEEDEAIKQDIHAVSSLLKMYFRELPNPLCTYQLYEKFVAAAQASDVDRLFRMREVVHELPPPHYRTLEYLMKHLARVANRSNETGMTPKNMAIVWAPNLIRCKELEAGGVAALKGIGVQAVVTEYLVRHADLIFNDKLPANLPPTTTLISHRSASSCSTTGRPKSLAISSPIRLMSLEEAQDKAKDDRKYIEVGGGPSSLPPKYHTVIELPNRRSALKNKRSPIGWKHFFSRNRSFSKPARKVPTPCEITVVMKNMPAGMPQNIQSTWAGRLRPVKSVESLVSSPLYHGGPSSLGAASGPISIPNKDSADFSEQTLEAEDMDDANPTILSKSSPATPVTDVHVVFHAPPSSTQTNNTSSNDPRSLQNPKTHNRSISHDSYFEFGEFRSGNNVYIDETLEEETMSQESSKLSLDNISSSGLESSNTSPRKDCSSSGFGADTESVTSKSHGRCSFRSPITPPPSAASIRAPMNESYTSAISSSSDDYFFLNEADESILHRSPLMRPRSVRPNKWRDSVVVSEDSPTSTLVCNSTAGIGGGNSNSVSSDDNLNNPNIIRLRDSVFTLQEEPESSQFSFKPLRPSSGSVSSSKYELDKNSSVDESSTESTPGDHFVAMTNIIYSPLINETSSPATTASSSCEQLSGQIPVVKCNPMAMQTANLFICPLYEAGVQSSDLSSDQDIATTSTNLSQQGTSDSDRTNTPVLDPITTTPQYENVSRKDISDNSTETTCLSPTRSDYTNIASPSEQVPVPIPEKHVYQNERVYQNQLVELDNANNASTKTRHDNMEGCEETENSELKEDFYGQHYENLSDEEADKDPNNYDGSNIYEDIDDEQSATKINNYEMIQVSNRHESCLPIEATTDAHTFAARRAAQNPPDGEQSDNEAESTYEKVQYSRNDQNEMVVHHYYSEIQEKPEATYTYVTNQNLKPNVSSEESSESHSHTEDVVTYLEVQTPGILKLRADSLDDQDHIQEEVFPSHIQETDSMSTFLRSPQVPGPIPEDGADEIRHIDSPVMVDNPLYGIELENREEQDWEDRNWNSLTDDEHNQENIQEAETQEKQSREDQIQDDQIQEEQIQEDQIQEDQIQEGNIHEQQILEEQIRGDNSQEKQIQEENNQDEQPQEGSIREENIREENIRKEQIREEENSDSLNSVCSIRVEMENTDDDEKAEMAKPGKVFGRCSSAPLTETIGLAGMALSIPSNLCTAGYLDDDDADDFKDISIKSDSALDDKQGQHDGVSESHENNRSNTMNKLLLCKRLSEPTLLFTNNSTQSKSKIDERIAAWKIADAKRLANRKQSVKELLSKFEPDSNNAVSFQNQNQGNSSSNSSSNLLSSSHGSGPGLPRPESKQNLMNSQNNVNNNNFVKNNNNNNTATTTRGRQGGNSGRFQHHRFSMGDILMSQSMSSADDLGSMKTAASNMVRSDTFPELRTEASKENHEDGDIEGGCPHSLSESDPPLVAEKVQHALRVAMSSVDMNDPSTRERIEKYKEERRTFLRQKISSELSGPRSPSSDSKGSISSLKSPDRESMSSTESVFTTATVKIISPSESCHVNTGNANNVGRPSDSPRKRAFSEDIPPTHFNQTKTIKTDLSPVKPILVSATPKVNSAQVEVVANTFPSCDSTSPTSVVDEESQEDINVKEKVAMWAVRKRAFSTTNPPPLPTVGLDNAEHVVFRNKGEAICLLPKPILKEAVSLPPEGFSKLPVLKRDVTSNVIEISKTAAATKMRTASTRSDGGKKIKDMAAFFEAKQF